MAVKWASRTVARNGILSYSSTLVAQRLPRQDVLTVLEWPETAFEEGTLDQCHPRHLDGELQTEDLRDP